MRHLALFCAAAAALTACKKQTADLDAEAVTPELVLESPAAAAWTAAGSATATGRASGLSNLTVNGVAADVEGGGFSAPVVLQRGVNVVEARGTDARGHTLFRRHGVLAGEFADPGKAIDKAVAVRVNRGGIDAVLAEAGALLDPALINDSLDAINPVYEDSFVWGTVSISADLGSIAFDPPILHANPAAGVIELAVVLPELDVWVPATGSAVGIGFNVDVWVGARNALINGLLTARIEGGELVMELVSPSVHLDGFWYDVSLLPWGVESWLFVDTIRTTLEDTLVTQIEEMVPALIEEQLAGLDLSFQSEIMGLQVSVEAALDTVSIDRDGLLVIADLDVDLPGAGTHPYKGYLAAAPGNPRPSLESDVAMTLSDDLVNRVLFEAWRAGALAMSLSSEEGTLEPVLLSQLGARGSAAVTIDAQLPPVVVATADGGLQAQIGELDVTILTPGGEHGDRLDLSVTAFVGLQIGMSGSDLSLKLREPELSLEVRGSDWGVPNETITNLLVDQLPINVLLLLLGDFKFPLPAFGNLAIADATVARDDSGVHTAIRVDLR